tara:strand:+ start:61266 stop:61409 length:144 start_codon:yes stop_codon:yes gene_type:complete
MAEIGPIPAFLIGIFVAVVSILIFWFFSRQNQNSADFYRATVCSGIL